MLFCLSHFVRIYSNQTTLFNSDHYSMILLKYLPMSHQKSVVGFDNINILEISDDFY